MPMCDIYIPANALSSKIEAELISTVSELIVDHEIRRFAELSGQEQASLGRKNAESIAWMFLHRPSQIYVGGKIMSKPHYKFVITIPQGTIDERFSPAINRDIFSAVQKAEGCTSSELAGRLWVFIHEVKDGFWGAAGRPMPLEAITKYVQYGPYGKQQSDRHHL